MGTKCKQISHSSVLKMLCNGPVIPAPRTLEDFKFALLCTDVPGVILLFGDINTLPGLLAQAKEANKRLIVHMDLLEGIGKDKAGIKFLARLGVTAIITTKPHLAKYVQNEGMIVIQRLFLVDSESLHTGVNMIRSCNPDALEVLPATIPASAVRYLEEQTGLPILAGGLLLTREDVFRALRHGLAAVSTSKRELWDCKVDVQTTDLKKS